MPALLTVPVEADLVAERRAIPLPIPLYREALGMEVMSPFEVASGCDVVEIGKRFPWLVLAGGIDKRVLAEVSLQNYPYYRKRCVELGG